MPKTQASKTRSLCVEHAIPDLLLNPKRIETAISGDRKKTTYFRCGYALGVARGRQEVKSLLAAGYPARTGTSLTFPVDGSVFAGFRSEDGDWLFEGDTFLLALQLGAIGRGSLEGTKGGVLPMHKQCVLHGSAVFEVFGLRAALGPPRSHRITLTAPGREQLMPHRAALELQLETAARHHQATLHHLSVTPEQVTCEFAAASK